MLKPSDALKFRYHVNFYLLVFFLKLHNNEETVPARILFLRTAFMTRFYSTGSFHRLRKPQNCSK